MWAECRIRGVLHRCCRITARLTTRDANSSKFHPARLAWNNECDAWEGRQSGSRRVATRANCLSSKTANPSAIKLTHEPPTNRRQRSGAAAVPTTTKCTPNPTTPSRRGTKKIPGNRAAHHQPPTTNHIPSVTRHRQRYQFHNKSASRLLYMVMPENSTRSTLLELGTAVPPSRSSVDHHPRSASGHRRAPYSSNAILVPRRRGAGIQRR